MKKFTKKALSLVLAIAILLTTMVTTFSVFANTESTPYLVEFESPAIPMNEMTTTDLSKIQVEMNESGTVVSGADIEWATDEAGVILDNVNKKLSAVAKGNYKLTATYSGTTKNIWVVVKEKSATDFYLIDYDFSTGYNPEEWAFVYYKKGQVGTGISYSSDPTDVIGQAYIGRGSDYVAMGVNNNKNEDHKWIGDGVLVSKNPIFNDFADYTVVTTVSGARTLNGWHGVGIGGRIKLDENGVFSTEQNSIIGYIMMYGTSLAAGSHNGSFYANGIYTYAEEDKPQDTFMAGDTAKHTIKAIYSGDNFIYNLNGLDIFDLSKADSTVKNDWAKSQNQALSAGAPAMTCWELTPGRFYKFSVKLNSNAMPDANEFSLYEISKSSPAIPMYEMTSISLNNTLVGFSNGDVVLGANINWSVPAESTGISYNSASNTLSAYTTGVFPITATDKNNSENTTTVFAVVEETGATKFNLLEYDFSVDDFSSSDWTVLYNPESSGDATQQSTHIKTPEHSTSGSYYGWKKDTANGGMQLSLNQGIPTTNATTIVTANSWTAAFAVVNTNEYLKHFENITLTTTANGGAHVSSDVHQWGGSGFLTNASLNDDGVFDTDYGYRKIIYMHFSGLGLQYNNSTAWGVVNSGVDVTQGSTNTFTGYMTEAGKLDKTKFQKLKVKIEGKNQSIYFNDTVIFSGDVTTKKEGNTNAGLVGLISHGTHNITYKDFCATLNEEYTTAEELAKLDEVVIIETPNTVKDGKVYLTAGTRIAMADIDVIINNVLYNGDELEWGYVRSNVTEVSDFFKTIVAFTAGEETISVTNEFNESVNITVVVGDAANKNAVSYISTDLNGTVEVTPIEKDNYAYQIKLTPNENYEVDFANFNVFSYGKTDKVVNSANADNTFIADFNALDDVMVNVAFKEKGGINIESLGATIRYASDTQTQGIRFGTATTNIKNMLGDNTAVVNGENCQILSYGYLMIPTALLENNDLLVDAENTNSNVINTEINKVNFSNGSHSTFVVTLNNIPDDMLDVEITARAYVKYQSEGGIKYVYADTIKRSYNSTKNAVLASEIKYDFYMDELDKGYITIVYDDARGDLGTVLNIVNGEYDMPLCAAVPPTTYEGAAWNSATVQLFKNIQSSGGEILGHHFTVFTSAVSREDKLAQLQTTYDTLTGYGLNVHGYILAGGNGQNDINRTEIEGMLRKVGFSYSDLYGVSENFYHPRWSLNHNTDGNINKRIDEVAENKEWQVYFGHGINVETTEQELRDICTYLKNKEGVEVVTYRYIYENFGHFRNPINWENGVTQ